MKSASYRISFLLRCTAIALCGIPSAFASDVSDAPPSVEIHLDVLSTLGKAPAATPPAASPFGKPTAAPPASASADTAKPHVKKKLAAKKKPHGVDTATAANAESAKHKHAKSSAANAKKEGVPKEEAKAAPSEKSDAAKAGTETAPSMGALSAVPPRLSDADIAKGAPVSSPGKGALPASSNGFPALLNGGESAKPAQAANAQPKPGTAMTPPTDLTAAASAPPLPASGKTPLDKDIPPAPPTLAPAPALAAGNSLPPPLPPQAPAASDKGAGNNPPSALNDALPPMTPAIPAAEHAKSDLPLLPTAENKDTTPPPASPATPVPSVAPAQAALQMPPEAIKAAPSPETPPALISAAAPAGAKADLMIPFNETATDLPLASTAQLDALAKTLADNPGLRVNILAYAGGPETTGIYPKRVSLARGIAVRNYLTATKGIDIERVNVKAVGNKNDGNGPNERVDVFILK